MNYKYKAAMESIMVACSWPAARIQTINPFPNELCTRCAQAEETYFHVLLECKCNAEIDREYAFKFQ